MSTGRVGDMKRPSARASGATMGIADPRGLYSLAALSKHRIIYCVECRIGLDVDDAESALMESLKRVREGH
jgi:hypothetical protein